MPAADSSRASAWRTGLWAGLGLPGWVLAASFAGFGALARETGLSLSLTVFSTATIWALPGQVALAEMQALGAGFIAIVVAVALVNARFLPMILALLPLLRRGRDDGGHHDHAHDTWRTKLGLYAVAQLIAITVWAGGMRVMPALPHAQRLPWLFGFGLSCLAAATAASAAGYIAAGLLPKTLKLALVFLSPVYFTLLFVGDVRSRAVLLSILGGAAFGPLVHLVVPQWSLLITGAAAGTAAFAVDAWLPKRGKTTGHRPMRGRPQ